MGLWLRYLGNVNVQCFEQLFELNLPDLDLNHL